MRNGWVNRKYTRKEGELLRNKRLTRLVLYASHRTHYNAETLVCYMDLFYFTDMKLDSAFR